MEGAVSSWGWEGGRNTDLAPSPGVGLAAGAGGGGVLEVPCLTGNTVAVSLPVFIWQEKCMASQGEWAKGAHWMAPSLTTHCNP